jgi:NitT/TauT family transport system substrate-binding protein
MPQPIVPKLTGSAGTGATRRQALRAGTALAGALVLPGVARSQAAAPIPVALSVPGPGNSISTPLELAAKLGFDRAEGIALRLRFVSGGGVAIKDLLSGNAEFGVFGLPAAMSANGERIRLVALAALDDLPLYSLMVRADLAGSIKSVADLKGRTIGIYSDSLSARTTSHLLADLVLRTHKVAPDSVRYISAGQSWETQSAVFISKAVDASMCDEPFGTRLVEERLAFQLFSTGNPADARTTPGAGFLRATLVARPELVEARADLAERMVNVVRRTLAELARRTPEDLAAVLDLHGAPRKAFITVFRKYPRQYSRDGKFSTAQLRDTEIFYRASVPGDASAKRLAVESMLVDRWSGRKP